MLGVFLPHVNLIQLTRLLKLTGVGLTDLHRGGDCRKEAPAVRGGYPWA